VDKNKYEARFWYNYNDDDPENIVGYGVNKPWVPPIKTPESLIAIWDRYSLVAFPISNPFWEGVSAWAEGLGTQDSPDGYWYANSAASGSQLYPTGLSKYFDMHSFDGLVGFTLHWVWVQIETTLSPFTLLIPIDVWLAIFGGAPLDNLWKIFIFYTPFNFLSGFGLGPTIIASFFKIEMEDGWGIMYN
jgi:hypothetical protein